MHWLLDIHRVLVRDTFLLLNYMKWLTSVMINVASNYSHVTTGVILLIEWRWSMISFSVLLSVAILWMMWTPERSKILHTCRDSCKHIRGALIGFRQTTKHNGIVFKKLVAYRNLLACVHFPSHASIVHTVINHFLWVKRSEKLSRTKTPWVSRTNCWTSDVSEKGAYNL